MAERLKRAKQGNFGDYKKLNSYLCELRFFIGPGYRVYFVLQNDVVLLWGGTKSTQNVDIKKTEKILQRYQ